MSSAKKTSMKDQLLAQIEFVEHRLDWYRDGLEEAVGEARLAFDVRAEQIERRCQRVAADIREWPEVQVGSVTIVDDVEAAADTLEADIEAAKAHDLPSYRRAMDRQIRAWRARADHLRMQSALGSMEVRDQLDAVGHRLSAARSGVLVELREAAADTKHLVVDVRDDVEEVLTDVRHAVDRFADGLLSDTQS